MFLPPIIFQVNLNNQGGYSIQKNKFFQNIIPIVSLAMIGGFFSTFVISVLMFLFAKLFTTAGWTFVECLIFGSLISSTDPVTVLSLLPVNVDKRLYMLLFGESALNDAVAIILFRFFIELKAKEADISFWPMIFTVFQSFGIFIGSFTIGIVMALIFAKITKHVWIAGYDGAIYELIMMLSFAYGSYLLAEVLGQTGIISIFFCGIGMAHYAVGNLTDLSRKAIKVTLKTLCIMCEGLIFLYLGLGLLSFGVSYDFRFILASIIAIFAGRLHVFFICGATSRLPAHKPVPFNQQFLIYMSGLRGAVAFALSVTLLENNHLTNEIKDLIFGTTVMTILFTVLGLGGIMPYLLKWLRIVDPTDVGGHASHHDVTDRNVQVPEDAHDEILSELDLQQPLFGWLFSLDVRF